MKTVPHELQELLNAIGHTIDENPNVTPIEMGEIWEWLNEIMELSVLQHAQAGLGEYLE